MSPKLTRQILAVISLILAVSPLSAEEPIDDLGTNKLLTTNY